ncbi:MAG: DUF1080 domain-containing protein [Planctomycetes bacterium]|nr:DUF1080 domain-containing protein [Planctomycetota bacterium]
MRLGRWSLGIALITVWVAASANGEKTCGKAINLFDGKSLDGWTYYLVDPNAKMEDVWSVRDGILICKGEPQGYLATERKFKNFRLIVEWRWAPGKKPGNSGVLMRMTGKPQMLPKCVEAQLKSGSAGDIWAFHGFQLRGDPDRMKTITGHKLGGDMVGVTKKQPAENEPGQWNRYEITLNGGTLTLVVNGKEVNRAVGCDVVAGPIALQSEGGEIHFRTVRLIPLGE